MVHVLNAAVGASVLGDAVYQTLTWADPLTVALLYGVAAFAGAGSVIGAVITSK